MTPQEMIDVIQAHADGKTIEFRVAGPGEDSGEWYTCSPPSPTFDFCHYVYRIKPPALRPHWPAIVQMLPSRRWLVSDHLYPTVEDATHHEKMLGHTGEVRLATEYPPVMLP